MKKFLIISGLLSFAGCFMAVADAKVARFVESPPLIRAVQSEVSDCTSASPLSVPLITWGGDVTTIYANGNAASTTKESLFGRLGLSLKLIREDVFANQVKSYLSCQSPYLRGTMGMINMAAEIANRDPRSKLNVIYQLTWSAGGDAMVVKEEIKRPRDLKGKTIAIQAYGPHIDYLSKILKDAGLSLRDVKLKWVKDLTGTGDSTPMAAFYQAEVQAAMVISPDALALTSKGTVGTGAEDSVKGARILLSTKTANRIISDVYAVRSDYLKSNRTEVEKFVQGMMRAEEGLQKLRKNKGTEYSGTLTSAAQILLDSPQATSDVEGMLSDADFVGWKGNVRFFSDANYPRGFAALNKEIQSALVNLGLSQKTSRLEAAKWDYASFKAGLSDTAGVEVPHFDSGKVASVVTKRAQQDSLGEGELFSFEVHFQPNQNTFSAEQYHDAFNEAINLASTYGGAIVTIEGHSDPLGFLKKKREGSPQVVLTRIAQSAKNLSLTRANRVRDSLVQYAKKKGVRLDPSQFAIVGHGITKPKTGYCGGEPCAPTTEPQWLDNMRVEFRIVQVEAEENVFNPMQ